MDKYIYSYETNGSVPKIKSVLAYSYEDAVERVVNSLDTEEKIYISHNWDDISQQLYDLYDINISDLHLLDEL